MTRDEFLDKQYHLSVGAGMNQRYHQALAGRWSRADRGAKIITGFFATAGCALAFVSALGDHAAIDWIGAGVASVAAIAAVVLNVVPFGSWEMSHRDLFRRWTDYREEVDSLEFNLADPDPSADMVSRLRELNAKYSRTCGLEEDEPDKALIDKCYRKEERSREQREPCTTTAP